MYSIVDFRIYNVVDGLTSELVGALTKEVFEHMTCSQEERKIWKQKKNRRKSRKLS